MAKEDTAIPDYIEYIKRNILYVDAESTESEAEIPPKIISSDKYTYIPTAFSKHYIFANNLSSRNLSEVNQLKLIFYILALRYFKKYQVRIETVTGFDADEEMKQYGHDSNYHVIYLNNNVLAMSSRFSIFYTNTDLIKLHEDRLALYARDLDTKNFFSRLNNAEKMLLKMWLLNVEECITENDELTVIVHEMGSELGFDNIILSRDNRDTYFGESIGTLPFSMDLSVIEYYQDMFISEVFLNDTKAADNNSRFVFLDRIVLGNGEGTENLTILNHVKYFDIRNRYTNENEFKWILANDYKLKIPSSYHLIFESKKFFINKIYKLDKPYERKMYVSDKSLIDNDYLYLYPMQPSLLDIYDFESIYRKTSIKSQNKVIDLNFEWSFERLKIISTAHYHEKNQIDISNVDISIEFKPDHKISNLEYYETQYILDNNNVSLYPQSYIENKDRWFVTKELNSIHFVMIHNEVCGFFNTQQGKVDQVETDKKVDVLLKFYPNKVIYSYWGDEACSDIDRDDVFYKKILHLVYYVLPKESRDADISPRMFKYLGRDVSGDEIHLCILNRSEPTDFVSRYHWNFDGDTLFLLTLKDISDLIRGIFIDLLSLGYNKKNIYWTCNYLNMVSEVSGNMFEQNINDLISTASLLKNFNSSDLNQKYDVEYYQKYNIKYKELLGTEEIKNSSIFDANNTNYIYISDYVIYDLIHNKRYNSRSGKSEDGLLEVLSILAGSTRELLELFKAENLAYELKMIFQYEYQAFMIEKIRDYKFDLDSPYYQKAQRDLIYIFVLLITSSIVHYYRKNLNDDKNIILVFDEDSSIIELLKKTTVYEELLNIIAIITGKNLGLCYIGTICDDDVKTLQVRYDRAAWKGFDGFGNSADLSANLFSKKLKWNFEEIFIGDIKEQLVIDDISKSVTNVKNNVIATQKYYRGCCSLIKDYVLTELFYKSQTECHEDIMYYDFIGVKKLACMKTENSIIQTQKISKLFNLVYWGERFEGVSCYMLLPAILEGNSVKEKGLVLYMGETVYLKKPVVSENEFAQFDGEHSKLAANATNALFDYLGDRFYDENRKFSEKIKTLEAELENRNNELSDCKAQIEHNIASIQDRDKLINELKASCESNEITLKKRDELISAVEKESFQKILIDDFNKYMNSNERIVDFYKKYKKNNVFLKGIDQNHNYILSVAIFEKNAFSLLNFNDTNYIILPDKSRFIDPEYRKALENYYQIVPSENVKQGFELDALPSLVRKGKKLYYCENKGVIKIKE